VVGVEWVRDVGSDIEMRGGGCRVGERCVHCVMIKK